MWRFFLFRLIGRPVGISFRDGSGTSGVLCQIRDNTLYVIEYMYQTQFATKQYPISTINNVRPFPSCGNYPWPHHVVY